jgi:single-stranded-DNA-specific exonuclease
LFASQQPPDNLPVIASKPSKGAVEEWRLPDGDVPVYPPLNMQELAALLPEGLVLRNVSASSESRRLLAQLFANRGFTTPAAIAAVVSGAEVADQIIGLSWTPNPTQAREWIERLRLPDPHQLATMGKAVERLGRALAEGERIIVSGDYDADGLTALALLVTFLKLAGADVRAFVPHRLEHGYGLNKAAIEKGLTEGCKLLITVDSGTSDAAQVAEAQAQGLDVIITDHHTLPEQLPQAVSVINPHVGGYPGEGLTGVGVAWKLCQALCMDVDERWWRFLPGLLDLVAIGSVADVTPMVPGTEVWLLARAGIQALRHGRSRPAVKVLMEAAGLHGELRPYLDARHIGFRLGPRLNAAGRLSEMRPDAALECLLTEDDDLVRQQVVLLDRANQQRQSRERASLVEAEAELVAELDRAGELPPVLVLARANWPAGIVGLLAGKLARRYQRPVLCLSGETSETSEALADDEEAENGPQLPRWWRGSGRSGGVGDLIALLRRVDQRYSDLDNGGLFLKLGGHAPAAGFTLAGDRLELLKQGLLEDVREHPLGPPPREPCEARVRRPGRSLGSQECWAALDVLTPTGPGNPEPRFYLEGAVVEDAQQVRDRPEDVRLRLRDNGRSFTVFVNGAGELLPAIRAARCVDAIVTQSVSRDKSGEAYFGLRVEALRVLSIPSSGSSGDAPRAAPALG